MILMISSRVNVGHSTKPSLFQVLNNMYSKRSHYSYQLFLLNVSYTFDSIL